MTGRKLLWTVLATLVLLAGTALSYLAFANLGRHKGPIESLLSARLGRPLVIEGPLELRLAPELHIHAEGVRLANTEWATAEEFLRVGTFATRIGLWSLVSGPLEVHEFTLADAELNLERSADGRANWMFGSGRPDDTAADGGEQGFTGIPLVVREAGIRNVHVTMREPQKPESSLQVDALQVTTVQDDLLDLLGRGSVDGRAVTLDGKLGPVQSLFSGRDIELDLSGTLDRFGLKASGVLGQLHPLRGADLALELDDPDVSQLLERLRLPPLASGPMRIDAQLKSVEQRTRLDLDATLGDSRASIRGTLQSLALKGADLSASLEDPRSERLLQALGLPVFATGPARVDLSFSPEGSGQQVDLGVRAGDVSASLRGKIQRLQLAGSDLRLQARAEDAHRLGAALGWQQLPAAPVTLGGRITSTADVFQFQGVNLELDGFVATLEGRVPRAVVAALENPRTGMRGTLQALAKNGASLSTSLRAPQGERLLQALDLPIVSSGPLRIEASLRDERRRRSVEFEASLGDLAARGRGSFRDPDLKDVELALHVAKPEVRGILEALQVPAFADGPVRADFSLVADGGQRIDVNLMAGDVSAQVRGKMPGLQLTGSDLQVEARAADAQRLAEAFGWQGLPAAPMAVRGRVSSTADLFGFEGIQMELAGLVAGLDGTVSRSEDREASLQFDAKAQDLQALWATLPTQPAAATGSLHATGGQLHFRNLDLSVGDSRVTGTLLLDRQVTPLRVEATLSSPRLVLTPWMPAAPDAGGAKPASRKRELLFDDRPLPLGVRRRFDATLNLDADVVELNSQRLQDVSGKFVMDAAGSALELRATGPMQGAIDGQLTITLAQQGKPRLQLSLKATGIRSDLTGDGIPAGERPPVNIEATLDSRGDSPRQLAAAANGRILLVEGSGKVKSGALAMFGGDALAQLATRLNPFRESDPFTRLDCIVAEANIVNGMVTLDPVLMQSAKVTVAAKGNIDLGTERISLDFTTRPRKGIGISPGMFTNPFIRLEGTLAQPGIGVGGAKAVASGAVAAATGGMSVIAEGLVDRLRGQFDECAKALEQSSLPEADAGAG